MVYLKVSIYVCGCPKYEYVLYSANVIDISESLWYKSALLITSVLINFTLTFRLRLKLFFLVGIWLSVDVIFRFARNVTRFSFSINALFINLEL